mmetsp:Transcript_371/g.780  ORF Transcript_371/g.780 Transcript_371/m.780 type:complete len:263 (-) Transcript_371:144-932(-)|eukprot:CAMPEP_0114238030 /NCGR_PEP_ID=MMETSP0058-20121206/7709_1 /TAXON_ID=36894 /ORGANISM="Pyramimonas parkeae, CCMP726" /LENGTH=262 /DNA_ID=CAMNT_0001350117 /DNA_START=99 /DNA_END=887 /DNA_ORIENTATION=+
MTTAAEISDDSLRQLRLLLAQLQVNPALLHTDTRLEFFKTYLTTMGAAIPEPPDLNISDEDEDDEHLEVDLEGTVEPDLSKPQQMGDQGTEITEAMLASAAESKQLGQQAMDDGRLVDALNHLTDAVLNNPTSSIVYGTRAQCFVAMKKPNAALRDCTVALRLNPDSARALKAQGMALSLLGRWTEAAKALRLACQQDYDEETNQALKFVQPKAQRVEDFNRRKERRAAEKAARAQERQRKKAEDAARMRRAQAQAIYEMSK